MSNGRIKTKNDVPAGETTNGKPVCSVCGETPHDGDGDWPAGPVFHCPGNSQAFGAQLRGKYHHSRARPHPNCMVCGADLGCLRCSGIASELLCMAQVGEGANYRHDNAHWGHKAALRKHGRLLLAPEERAAGIAFLHSAVERIGKHHG